MPRDDAVFADLADLVLNLGRLIRARTPNEDDLVVLSETERHVMRLVDLDPGCSPSDIADRGRLQRTNVSTALRSLEQKAMIKRTSGGGRGVTVHPTARAATNLAKLRAAWSHELASVVDEDRTTVRTCANVLARIELALLTNTTS